MEDNSNTKSISRIIKLIYRVVVVVILVGVYLEVKDTRDQINAKLKDDLQYIFNEQSKTSDGMVVVKEKLKYDLEYIKATQATAQENHEILLELLKKKGK